MKKPVITYLSALFILLLSCGKADDCDGFKSKFTPMWYETYFELLKPDGSSYDDQEVKISSLRKLVNGELVPANPNFDEWYELFEINYHDSIPDVKIFGMGCESCPNSFGLLYASGPDECGYGYFENWISEQFYLIEFPDLQTDTLLIKDILEPGGNRSFKFYINNVETQKNNTLYYPYIQVIH